MVRLIVLIACLGTTGCQLAPSNKLTDFKKQQVILR